MGIEIEFIKKNQKIGMQKSCRNIVLKNSIIFQYDIDLADGMLYRCLKRNSGTKRRSIANSVFPQRLPEYFRIYRNPKFQYAKQIAWN
jgi:hypothetical protein